MEVGVRSPISPVFGRPTFVLLAEGSILVDSDFQMLLCPKCNCSVRNDRLPKHLLRVHGSPPTEPRQRTAAQIARSEIEKQYPINTGPESVRALNALRRGTPMKAGNSEACSECKQRIIYLNDERNRLKAFTVDKLRNVVGVHVCGDSRTSESIYAINGGMIDSNRRKH
jgi:hypothetical protein